VNAADKLGLTPLQILLAKLLDLAFIQNKPQELRPSKVYTVHCTENAVSMVDSLFNSSNNSEEVR
jgi:hypothetical protein